MELIAALLWNIVAELAVVVLLEWMADRRKE